jgi:antitoxin CcdA
MPQIHFDPAAPKKATNLSLNSELVEQARALGINLSRACERGLEIQIAEVPAKQWQEENREALAFANEYVEQHGLPLARFRQF